MLPLTLFNRESKSDGSKSVVRMYKNRALRALDDQITIMAKMTESPADYIIRTSLTQQEKMTRCFHNLQERHNYRKLKRARVAVKKNLLSSMAVSAAVSVNSRSSTHTRSWRRRRRDSGTADNRRTSTDNEDRTILIEAIKAEFAPKYIKILLYDYPRACDCDINRNDEHRDEEEGHSWEQQERDLDRRHSDHPHPIHIACSNYHEIIAYILQASPESAAQRDEEGRLPIDIYLQSVDLTNIDAEKFSSVITLFMNLNPTEVNEIYLRQWSVRQESVLLDLLLNNFQMRRRRGSGASSLSSSELSLNDFNSLSEIIAR